MKYIWICIYLYKKRTLKVWWFLKDEINSNFFVFFPLYKRIFFRAVLYINSKNKSVLFFLVLYINSKKSSMSFLCILFQLTSQNTNQDFFEACNNWMIFLYFNINNFLGNYNVFLLYINSLLLIIFSLLF